MRRRPYDAALLCLLLLIAPGGCADGPVRPDASETVETKPVLGVAVEGAPRTTAEIDAAVESLGAPAGIVLFFLAWPDADDLSEASFPTATCEAIRRSGAVPCVTWEPMVVRDGRETAVPADDILSGKYDEYLDAFADGARAYGGKTLIRFAHEMNLRRYHWGGTEAEYGPESPRRYRRMFRYVVERCRAAGAMNLLWVFCPNADSVPAAEGETAWNRASAYHPGDAYVDILGMDGYNWGVTRTEKAHGWTSSWRSFDDIFGALRAELVALAPEKPLMVCETASVAAGGDKTAWVRAMTTTTAEWRLLGLVWFDIDKENDWRLRSDAPDAPRMVASATTGDHESLTERFDDER